jgi:hypothetical protein
LPPANTPNPDFENAMTCVNTNSYRMISIIYNCRVVGNRTYGSILVSAPTTLKYYSFAGAAVAMTTCTSGTCAALSYLITDHLGSVDAVTDANGALVSEQSFDFAHLYLRYWRRQDRRYLPFGGVRTDAGTVTQTDFGYTGQPFDRLRTGATWMRREIPSRWG